ncbi:Oidioi.mRNA.OKI2018_I69.PAR.g12968.t1.cds [Oikopleura dioica]|uniref:Oidioi.mRNA.OKI2018_I69.PAR.g12968.t1.cds n=1 Tax=Oikopleura dioica TaxID=34765 RepID=A0ABN7S2J3_OIKDI|nr:Oidioi.mRNA.OKI2018_I69.PAR.g12968.t1.cds [Oikopleura dioica]
MHDANSVSLISVLIDEPPYSMEGYRPAQLPESIMAIHPTLKLSTKDGLRDHKIDWENPDISKFKPDARITVVTHGWNDGYYEEGLLDWHRGALRINYNKAAANTQVAGRALGHFFGKLRAAGFNEENFYCAGHSLGAHVCAFAGKWTQEEFGFTIARITGLDAAGPLFEKVEAPARLDHTDARFVDLMHTNGAQVSHGLCGLNEPFGHADFYPNGGNHQPGCGFFDLYCSHMRAVDLWIHSIKMPSCVFVTAFQVVKSSTI